MDWIKDLVLEIIDGMKRDRSFGSKGFLLLGLGTIAGLYTKGILDLDGRDRKEEIEPNEDVDMIEADENEL